MEVEDHRRQVSELVQSKKQLQAEVTDLRERVEIELIAKNEEAGMLSLTSRGLHQSLVSITSAATRRLQSQLQELEIATSASSTVHTGNHICYYYPRNYTDSNYQS